MKFAIMLSAMALGATMNHPTIDHEIEPKTAQVEDDEVFEDDFDDEDEEETT